MPQESLPVGLTTSTSISSKKTHEENLAAQRATAEAIAISRATLQATLCQEEQLEHCDVLRERHQYIVDKSERIVKGMTWSGWFANAFSKDVRPPPDNVSHVSVKEQICVRNVSQVLDGNGDDGNIPEVIEEPATIVKNLECNVILLEQCQSKDELDALLEICNQLNISARKSIEKIQIQMQIHGNGNRNGNGRSGTRTVGENSHRCVQLLRKLGRKIDEIEVEQNRIVEQFRGDYKLQSSVSSTVSSSSSSSLRATNHIRNSRISSSPSTSERIWSKTSDTTLQARIKQQDEHLDALANGIQELMHNGTSIGISLEQQNVLLEKMNDGTDELTEKSKMVSRRADRVAHRSLWRKPKPNFKFSIALQHVESKRFLSVEPQNKKRLALHDKFHPETAAFEVYERTAEGSALVGLMNKCTRTWLGQSTMGFIVCNAKSFGPNEEWELDYEGEEGSRMTRTKMLCASANWGSGGWLTVNKETENFSVGGYDAVAKKKASLWSVVVLDETISDV